MTSVITFTPVTGCFTEGPVCYLIEVDDVVLMLDCGVVLNASSEAVGQYDKLMQKADAILLTHPDISHIGGYVRFHNRYLQTATAAASATAHSIPVYGTIPLQNMGRMLMTDLYHAQQAATASSLERLARFSNSGTDPDDGGDLTLATIRAAFDHITPLRYSQPINLTGKCQGITITAYGAGHTVGGTIWKIRKATDEIVYAPDFNHRKERHLNGTVLLSGGVVLEALYRPSLLIMGTYSALSTQQPRKAVEQVFLESITKTLQREGGGGTVLLPIDTSARVLEIAFLLDQIWQEKAELQIYQIILVSACAPTTLKYAKSMLEWMGGHLAEQFGNTRENPLDLKFVKLCRRIEEIEKTEGPKVVLASFDSLEVGGARHLFCQIATNPHHKVILTNKGIPGTLSRVLFDAVVAASHEDLEHHDVLTPEKLRLQLSLKIIKKVPLEGAELMDFRSREQKRLEREAEQAAVLARSKHIMEDEISSDDSASDDGGGSDMAELLSRQFDVYVREPYNKKGLVKGPGSGSGPGPSFRMFPYLERKRKFDDYGEAVNHSNYTTESEALAAKRERLGNELEDQVELDEPELLLEPDPIPMKAIEEMVTLKVACAIHFIGIEGRSDGRSLKTILTQLAPRKLILVHGSKECTDHLQEYCRNHPDMSKCDVLVPHNGSRLTVAAASFIFPLKISDALLKSLRFHKYDDYELARIHGSILYDDSPEGTNEDSPEEKNSESEVTSGKSTLPVLDLVKLDDKIVFTPSPAPVMVGEVRFAELKKLLQQEGVKAEFQGEGILVCNEAVCIRKDSTGKIVLEGSLSADYYQIRRLLYSQQAVL